MLIQGGIFGLGPNSSLNQWNGRDDVSIQLMWQLENFGFGNLAMIKAQRGQQSQAIIDLRRAQDTVAEEVNQALARLQSAAARVIQADRALRTGIITCNGAVEGLKQTSRFDDVLVLISRPQEAIYALQLLQRAFGEYFTTVAEYNRAQFELFHALGYPAREISELRPPGEVQPVNTSAAALPAASRQRAAPGDPLIFKPGFGRAGLRPSLFGAPARPPDGIPGRFSVAWHSGLRTRVRAVFELEVFFDESDESDDRPEPDESDDWLEPEPESLSDDLLESDFFADDFWSSNLEGPKKYE